MRTLEQIAQARKERVAIFTKFMDTWRAHLEFCKSRKEINDASWEELRVWVDATDTFFKDNFDENRTDGFYSVYFCPRPCDLCGRMGPAYKHNNGATSYRFPAHIHFEHDDVWCDECYAKEKVNLGDY